MESFQFFSLAFLFTAIFSVVCVGQVIGGDVCTTYLRPAFCGTLTNDTRIRDSADCPLFNASAVGSPIAFDAFWFDSRGPLTHCQLDGTTRVYNIPLWLQTSLKGFATLSTFVNGADYRSEASITVVTVGGVEHRVGSLLPNDNALTGNNRGFDGPQREGFPFNGDSLCGGAVSSQMWPIAPSLASLGLAQIRIYDSRSTLKTYALSVDNCTQVAPLDPSVSVTRNSTNAVDQKASFISNTRVNSWPACALSARANHAEAFSFLPNTGVCYILNTSRSVVRGETALTPITSGAFPLSPHIYTSPKGIEGRNSTLMDQWSMLRSDLFGDLTPRLFPIFDTPPGRAMPRLSLWASSTSRFAVGVSQFSVWPTPAFVTITAAGNVFTCGNVSSPQVEMLAPFYDNNRNNNSYCDSFSHCRPQQQQSAFDGKLTVDLSTWPNRTTCGAQANLVLLYTNGGVGGSTYSYVVYTTTQYQSFSQGGSAMAQRHERTSVYRYESFTTAQGFAHFYNLEASSPALSTSPEWKMTDSFGRTVNTTLWCDAYDVPHYEAAYRQAPTATSYRCGEFTSLAGITLACNADSGCAGYTTEQNSSGFELPKCLYSSLAAISPSETTSFFKKVVAHPSCSFPALGGLRISVRVTSSVASAALYEVLADGVVVGSCTNLPTVDTTDSSCFDTFPCFNGDIPQGTVAVTVRSTLPMDAQRRCSKSVIGVSVSFDAEYNFYTPPSSCLTAIPILSNCVSATTAVPSPCSGGARLRLSVALVPTACTITSLKGLFSDVVVPNTTVGVIIVVDTSGMPASDKAAGVLEVLIETSDGLLTSLGHVVSDPSGLMRHFGADQTPVPSYGLCTGTIPTSDSTANAHYFAIPAGLRLKGLGRVVVKGMNARVVGLHAAAAGCEAPNPKKATDIMFGQVTPYLLPSAPLVSPTVSTLTVFECALTCFSTQNCFVYSFSEGLCFLHNGFGSSLKALTSSSRMTGSRILPTSGALLFPRGYGPFSSVSSAISSLASSSNIYAFFADTTRSLSLTVEDGQHATAILSHATFAASGSVILSTPGVGGAVICGGDYSPWAGLSAPSSTCTTLASCPSLDSRTEITGTLQLTFNNTLTQCDSQRRVLGLLGTSGNIRGGAHYTVVKKGVSGSSPVVGGMASVASEVISARIDGAPSILTVVEQYSSPSPSRVTGSSLAMCRIRQKVVFKVHQNSSPLNVSLCPSSPLSIEAAISTCESDAHCKGFSVDSTSGTFLCFSDSLATNTSSTEHFFEKISEISCSFDLMTPGVLRVSISQLNLYRSAGNDAKVYINNRLLGRCGYTEPFISGYDESGMSDCSNYLTCVDMVVPETGTLRIVLPNVNVTCAGQDHFGSVLVQLDAAASESRNLHRGASTMPYRRVIRSQTPSKYAFMVSDTSQAAVLVRQDRYRCGFDCLVPFQLNLTVGGANQRLCGGLSGFAEGTGFNNECAMYYYCGTASGGSPISFTPITAEMTFIVGDEFRTTTACDTMFHSVAFSNGLMLGADSTHYATRTVFAKRYNGSTTSVSLDDATRDLSTYIQRAHQAMDPSSLGGLRRYDKAFPIFNNLLSVSSTGFVLYDFADANEDDKSVGEGTYACIGDKISVDGRQVVCQMRFTTNYISVSVAQTKYDTITDTITITTNGTTKMCGGDRTFFGYRGTLDECNRFYTCFEGFIEQGELVTITYSSSVIQNSRCRPSALALITGSVREPVPDLVCSDPLLPFKCYPSRQCLSMAQICDRFIDCADQSDEADCSAWRFVAKDVSPSCPALEHYPSAKSVDACRSLAVADSRRPNVLTFNSSGCFTFTCVIFSSPALQPLPSSGGGTELHALVINPSDFGYCSDSLHCSGHGVVQSLRAPCTCVCDANYVGADCSLVTTPGVARQLVVVFDRTASVTQSLLREVETTILSQLPSLYTVVASAVERRSRHTGIFLTIRNSVNNRITSEQILGLLTNSTQERALKPIMYAGALYMTATQTSTPRSEFSCRREQISDPLTCSGSLRTYINSTRSLTVTVYGIAIINASQWVDVTLSTPSGASQTLRCTVANAVVSIDYSQPDTLCQKDTVCTFPFTDGALIGSSAITVELSPSLNPTSRVCSNAIARVSAAVDGRIFFQDDTLATYEPTHSSSHNNAYLYSFFALLAIGLISLVVAVTWFRLRRKYPRTKIVGPLAGGLTLFLITFSIVLLMYYFDSETHSYTHSFVLEDYRDPQCGSSVYAPVPIRAGIIPGDGKCTEARFVGRQEDSVFIGARLSNERAYPIEVRRGSSYTACSSSPWEPIFPRTCLPENEFLSDKSESDLQWFSVRGMEKNIATSRLQEVRVLNPAESPSITVPVAILPPDFRYLSDAEKVTFLHRGSSYSMMRPQRDELTLVASAPGDPYLFQNAMPLEEVRFTQSIWTRKSVVDGGGLRQVDDVPAGTYKVFDNKGTLFDVDLVKTAARSFSVSATSSQAGTSTHDAFIFSGVSNGPFDLSKRTSDYTLAMWVRCPSSARGLPYVMMDGWVGEDFTSPLVDRLVATIENGDLGPNWFDSWTVGSAVYLNGGNGRIALASASPSAGLQKVEWDAFELGVERLFDDTWHYLAFSVSVSKSGQMTVKLFVDGEHDASRNGWTACVKDFFQPLHKIGTSELVSVTSQRAVVTPDGVIGVGYFGGGVFAVTVYDYAMTQQQVFQSGSQHMQYFSDILVNESLALGICTAVITAIIVLYSIYVAFQNEFGVSEEEFEEEAQYDERGHRVRQNSEIRESKGSIFTTSVNFVNFCLPVILMFQIITMFLQSFDWPKDYADFFRPLAVFSLDLDSFNINVPIILWPLIQFALAMVLFFVMMVLAKIDRERFITVTEVYREKVRVRLLEARSRQRRVDDTIEMIDIPKPNYQWVVHLGQGARLLTPDQQETLTRSLTEILQSRSRSETNMRVFTRNLVNMGDLGVGIILYERIQGKVFISLRTSENTLEHDQQADIIRMKQTYFEQICNNVECPEHKTRLLPDDLHSTTCVHSSNPYYRSKECPRKCIMYKCLDQQCEYAVCEFCYSAGGSAVSGAVSDALKRLKAVREVGFVQTFGTVIALLWGVIYIPAVKSALMIIGCHKRFKCEFDNCWQNPSVYYMVMVLISVLILTCVAVGYVFIEAWILKDRRDKILQLLPQQTRRARNRIYDFIMPKKTIFRGDYNDFLDEDKSILCSFYTSYEFDYFYASPVSLFYRLVLIIVVACPPEDSLTQLALATTVSLVFALILVLVSMHKNVWIEGLARLGAVHILVQLALMCLHRVDLRDNIFSTGYDEQMVAVTFLYIGIVGLLLVITVVVPYIRKAIDLRERRRKQMLNSSEQIYDIGFWGEIRSSADK